MILQWFKTRIDGRAGEINPTEAARVLSDRAKRMQRAKVRATCDQINRELGRVQKWGR